MAQERKIPKEVLDQLLSGRDPAKVFESDLVDELKKALAERVLDAEMDVHLEQEEERSAGKHRKAGAVPRRVLTETGKLPLSIPRDRQGRFESQLIEKYRSRFPGFDEKVIALYARGMTTRDIQSHVRELYGLEISPDLVSAVTEAVYEELSMAEPASGACVRRGVLRCATGEDP